MKELNEVYNNEKILFIGVCVMKSGQKSKTPHTHLYIEFKNPIYFSSLKSIFLCSY